MFHPQLAALDHKLKFSGEWIFLHRRVGTTPQSLVQCKIKALVNPLTVEQLIGSIVQQNFLVTISPTSIARAQWPGGKPPGVGAQGGIIDPVDPRLPTTQDFIYLRGGQKALTGGVSPIFDRGMCIRIDMKVLG